MTISILDSLGLPAKGKIEAAVRGQMEVGWMTDDIGNDAYQL